MALTLTEASKLSNDVLLSGVIETIVNESPVLQHMPFIEIVGNSLTYNRENAAPTVAFYNVGDAWAESTPTFSQVTATLKILGGDADVDNYVAASRSNVQDLEAAIVELKAKAVQQKFDDTFINGDTASDTKSFDGIDKLTLADQTIEMGANGATLTLDKLDELIDSVKSGKPHMLIMGRRTRRKLNSLVRASGSGFLQTDRNMLGQMVQFYDGVPIGISDWVSDEKESGHQPRLLDRIRGAIRGGWSVGADGALGPSGGAGRQPGDEGRHPHPGQVVRSRGPLQHRQAGQAHRGPELDQPPLRPLHAPRSGHRAGMQG